IKSRKPISEKSGPYTIFSALRNTLDYIATSERTDPDVPFFESTRFYTNTLKERSFKDRFRNDSVPWFNLNEFFKIRDIGDTESFL
ncbi:hypothetical protein HHI36_002160, partial [Cryptolaemus montrouzieri]